MVGDDRAATGPAKGPEKLPELAWLRRLVTALAVVMMLGMVAVVAILWIRLSAPPPPALPPDIALPGGERAAAVTFARDFTVVVTSSGRVLVYDAAGRLHHDVTP